AWAILGQALGWQVALGGAAVLAGGALVVVYEGTEARSVEAPVLVPEERPASTALVSNEASPSGRSVILK
ncbi:MAG TPA: hypothetical protein VG709_06540, partial [Actinomycetota bacterium]|nr:hypothetical protein [Actinomycetota bacterium]